MVLMYCYGSSFHANRYRLATPSAATLSLSASNGCGNGGRRHSPDGRRDGAEPHGSELTANGSGLELHPCDGNTLTGITAITPMSVSFSEKVSLVCAH
uniref:Uncharacterized protein n=1 Tax=Anopheles epiroticus TaxID=199890 RepID=A0A182PUQ8_9DIPT